MRVGLLSYQLQTMSAKSVGMDNATTTIGKCEVQTRARLLFINVLSAIT